MSRDWNEHRYCNAENLWSWIDEQASELDVKLESYKELCGETYKMLLMGRKEMLDAIASWLHEDGEATLGEIAERWGLGEKDDQ